MGSTRLPGKVLMELEGKPLLQRVVERVKRAKKIDEIIIATTKNKEDKKLTEFAEKLKVKSYAGSEDDVLDRYYQAAKKFGAENIVRITSDCPLIDPEIVDDIISYYLNNDFDYVSNTISPTYPDGLDTEVFSFKALERAWKEAKKGFEREHVTPYINRHPEIFRLHNFENKENLSALRWTVDTEKDLQFAREIFKRLKEPFGMKDVLQLLKREPHLLAINEGLIRNEKFVKEVKNGR